MSLLENCYEFYQKYMPLYDKVRKMKYSQYFSFMPYHPALLFEKQPGSYALYDENMDDAFWFRLFRHQQYGPAFFAYHTAIIECLPRLVWSTFYPSFFSFQENKFHKLVLLFANRKNSKEILIDSAWFYDLAENPSLLKVYSPNIERVSAWKLFFASLALYNSIRSDVPQENCRLSLISQPNTTWHLYHPDKKDGRHFDELGITDVQSGQRVQIEECRFHTRMVQAVPEGWQLANLLPDRV